MDGISCYGNLERTPFYQNFLLPGMGVGGPEKFLFGFKSCLPGIEGSTPNFHRATNNKQGKIFHVSKPNHLDTCGFFRVNSRLFSPLVPVFISNLFRQCHIPSSKLRSSFFLPLISLPFPTLILPLPFNVLPIVE